jgi:hypothetical protein
MLLAAAADPATMFVGEIKHSADGAPVAASVVWPDGATGFFTGHESQRVSGALDGYEISYMGSVNHVYVQPPVARDDAGNVVNRPAIRIQS